MILGLKTYVFTSVVSAGALSASCKPRMSVTQTQALPVPSSALPSTGELSKSISTAEKQLAQCPFYLSYGYALNQPDSYQAARAGLFPQAKALIKTSVDVWHSTADNLMSVLSKCNINLPYTERISISYTEREKSSCAVEWMKLNEGNIIRIAALDGDSHHFNGVVSEKSKLSLFKADSVKTRAQFFRWFAEHGAGRCTSAGRWFTPLARMHSALSGIAALSISYQQTTRARLEVWPENTRSSGAILAREFLSVLKENLKHNK